MHDVEAMPGRIFSVRFKRDGLTGNSCDRECVEAYVGSYIVRNHMCLQMGQQCLLDGGLVRTGPPGSLLGEIDVKPDATGEAFLHLNPLIA